MDRWQAARELGVPPTASPVEVERAFRVAARLRHPDLGGHPLAFRRATEARDVLLRPRPSHPLERAIEVVVRYHPAVLLVEALARAVERRTAPR